MDNFREILQGSKLYRSKVLVNLNDEDKALLINSGIKTIIDLRAPEEIKDLPDTEIKGINNISIPLINSNEVRQKLVDLQGMKLPDMIACYQELVNPSKKEAWTKIFEVLLNNNDGVLFHCASGKDRTGIVSAVILSLLGIDKEYIYNDYFVTNNYNDPHFMEYANKLPEPYKGLFLDHFSAKKEYLDAMFESIVQNFGSIDNFYKENCNLDKEKIAVLYSKYKAQ